MPINSDKPLSNLLKGIFLAIFFSTGFSALIFQIFWQRVLTLHAGIDIYSVTTVIAAFMTGLGLGSLLGGHTADRLSVRGCFILFFISNCIVGIFGFFSLWLFYDVYSGLVHYLNSTVSSFLFHFLLLCIPTTFMGLSLPLLSRALVRTRDEMSSLVGALYGMNTLGAAVGAGLGTWYMLGTLGFITSIKIASSINIVCGLFVIAILSRLSLDALDSNEDSPIQVSASSYVPNNEEGGILMKKPSVWILMYGLTGFAALSLEIVWFRLLDVAMLSTSYLFGNLLFIYLCGVGLGSLVSSFIIKRVKRPDMFFLWSQYVIGLSSILCILFLIFSSQSSKITQYFIYSFNVYWLPSLDFKQLIKYFIFLNFAPIFIIGLPTFFMGMCFPLIQRIVSRQMETLGRNLSKLLVSNIIGNILGSLVTGFFLVDFIGTPKTLIILSVLLTILGIIAGFSIKNSVFRVLSVTSIVLISFMTIIVFPNEKDFWSFFHFKKGEAIFFKEDHTSLNTLIKFKERTSESPYYYEVFINGETQSRLPFGSIHSILGIAPALYHHNPKTALAIGFGSGDTLYSIALDKRLEKTTCLEISKAQIDLVRQESQRDAILWRAASIFQNPRMQVIAGDGRKFLLHSKEKFDIIQIDAIQPNRSYSGNLYSVEFFELIRKNLKPGGIFCQWIPTARVERSIMKVFPYVLRFDNFFVLASNEPINFNRVEILERLDSLDVFKVYGNKTGKFITHFFTNTSPEEIQSGNITEFAEKDLNLDLFPRDEYFINNKIDRLFFKKPANSTIHDYRKK